MFSPQFEIVRTAISMIHEGWKSYWYLEIIVLLSYATFYCTTSYQTQLRCLDSEREPWYIQDHDSVEAGKKLQDWIYAYQNDCSHKQINHEPLPEIGIGSTLQYITNQLLWCLSQNFIYRPTSTFAFADFDPKNCTLGISSIDCYFKPMSTCGFEKVANPLDIRSDVNIKEVLGNFSVTHGDVCTLGRLLQKPIQWVHAQFIDYMMRPRHDIAEDIQKRLDIVYAKKRLNPDKSSVIGVHVRDGNTYDFGRRVLNLTTYLQFIDKKAEELAAQGKPVVTVFLCSHLQEHNIKSSEYMNKEFPRPYEFIVLPHVVLPHLPFKVELDDALANKTFRSIAPLRQMFVEYLSDVEILAQSDFYLGVTSNVYTLVAGKRIVRQYDPATTCYIDSRHPDVPLLCENNPQSHDIWKMYFGHLLSTRRNPDPGGGYETGTPFYTYE